jgi:crotonobetainyl-CoA:carnitine CoA-transferase CaiB-like acyl-CoA transferase
VIGANGNSVYDRLVTLMNRPDMKSDSAPRFASDATRVDAEGEINAVIEEYVSSLDAEEVIKNLEDARVPAGMIMTIEDVRTMDGWIDRSIRGRDPASSRAPEPSDSPTTPSPALTRSLSSVHSSDTDLRR